MILNWVVDVPGIDFPSFDKTEEWRAGRTLTEQERGKILTFKEMGLSHRAIARKIGRSPRVIRNFLVDPKQYASKKKRGSCGRISSRDERRLLYLASNQITSASKLQRSMDLKISIRRVQQLLHDASHLRYRRMRKVPRWPITISKTEFTGSEIIWVGLRNGRPSYSVMRKNSISTVLMVWCTAGMTYGRRSQSTPVDPTVVDPWWFRGPFMPVGNPNWQFSKGSRMRCHTYRHLVAFYYPYYRRIARLLWFFSRITRLYTQPTSRKCGYCWKTSR